MIGGLAVGDRVRVRRWLRRGVGVGRGRRGVPGTHFTAVTIGSVSTGAGRQTTTRTRGSSQAVSSGMVVPRSPG